MSHSTKSYSNDLRDRVVKARLSGVSVKDVSGMFDVSRACVYRWVMLYQETGSAHPKRRGGYKQPKIADMTKFEAFAKAHAHSTLTQMKEKWEVDVSEMSVSRALKRLGWTRKKSSITTANAMKRNAKSS
jgi:transposase